MSGTFGETCVCASERFVGRYGVRGAIAKARDAAGNLSCPSVFGILVGGIVETLGETQGDASAFFVGKLKRFVEEGLRFAHAQAYRRGRHDARLYISALGANVDDLRRTDHVELSRGPNIVDYMQVLIVLDAETYRRLEQLVPGKSRRRSAFIREAIRKSLWELEERRTRQAYLDEPDREPPPFDPSVWEPLPYGGFEPPNRARGGGAVRGSQRRGIPGGSHSRRKPSRNSS
jgi:hypothetical protein